MAKVLMEVTEDNLETGMRGYPVGYCSTSTVDPDKGLFYAGHALSEMTEWQPEQVIYLLYHGKEGSKEEVTHFSSALKGRMPCKQETLNHIYSLPRHGRPMNMFCSALLIEGALESLENYREDCLNAIARIPQIAAAVINHHAGWGTSNPSKPELGYMENFTQMLRVPNANPEELTDAFRLFNVLHYDHGGGNLSAFVGKAVASGLEDMYGCLAAAMAALAGPRHGRANQDCLEMVEEILHDLGPEATAEQVEGWVRRRLADNKLVFGFGHAVLRVEDPRATVLRQVAQKKYASHPLVKIVTHLRDAGEKVLKENPKVSNPHVNVDSVSGAYLAVAGFPFPEYFTVLFGMARVVGISIQIVYERLEARAGKGTPIVRPKYIYNLGKDNELERSTASV